MKHVIHFSQEGRSLFRHFKFMISSLDVGWVQLHVRNGHIFTLFGPHLARATDYQLKRLFR